MAEVARRRDIVQQQIIHDIRSWSCNATTISEFRDWGWKSKPGPEQLCA